MTRGVILLRLREIVEKLEQRLSLIERWLSHDDPELVAHGQSQKIVIDEYHVLLRDLVTEIEANLTESD